VDAINRVPAKSTLFHPDGYTLQRFRLLTLIPFEIYNRQHKLCFISVILEKINKDKAELIVVGLTIQKLGLLPKTLNLLFKA
jgi:hypothetical protein